jgi:arylsulfatase A-like enzyme
VRFGHAPTWPSRLGLLAVVPVLLTETGGRPVAAKALRILQPSLAEGLYYDALDSLEDRTIPPPSAELEPVRVSRPAEAPRPPNVVLVFLESVAAHNTSLFNPPLDTTPNLVRLAKQGLWARDQSTVVPHTSKSIAASLCGQVPWLKTEIEEARLGALPGRCLPALLSDVGYRTAFFQTADESFERRAEMMRFMGFGFFRARDSLKRGGFDKVNYFGIEDRAMLDPGIAWSKASDAPFFATYLTLTSHHDYGVPRDFPRRKRYPGVSGRRMKQLDAVRYVDTFVGELVAAYEEAGLADNTLFILHGDHGEGFNEHGRSQHDLVIWEEGLHVPMVIWGPGVLGGRTGVIEGPRTSYDVLPTVLDAVGARVDGGYLPGTSLLKDVPEDRTVYHSCWRSHRCLAQRRGRDKFIDHYRERAAQVFDLGKDPAERKDLARARGGEQLAKRSEEARNWRARVNGRLLALQERAKDALQTPDSSPAVARFGGAMDALGCTVDTPVVVPGESLWLSCRWRLPEAMGSAWRATVRAKGGFANIETDHAPLDGQLPTFTWKPGHAVTDPVRVKIPVTARPGPVTLEVGWERYGGSAIGMDGGGNWLRAGTAKVVKPDWNRNPPVTRSAAP